MAGDGPDPGRVQSKEDLARELTALRSGRGYTVRDLARALDAPVATVGDYFSGRHLPGLRQVPLFRSIVIACGVTDDEQLDAWLAALARARQSSDGRTFRGPAPYRGLEPFREDDAELFFGRRAALADLLEAVRAVRADVGAGLIVLVGPSGSGKSSLLMAGLLPAVRSEGWDVAVVGVEQLETSPGEPRTLVILDQIEEVLTAPDGRRQILLDRLGRLAASTVVVASLRADFYQAAAAETVLLDGLRHHQQLLGPMTADEVRDAITGPAVHLGAVVEEGLVDLVLSDLAPAGNTAFAHDPGTLPLLSYALLAAWERAGHHHLAVSEYVAVGGIRGAVRQAAESLYHGLTEPEKALARRVFARLVRVDREGPSTRRRAAWQELETGDPDTDAKTALVLERFVHARLVTVDADTVQISHEALLSAWPRLAAWVESDRDWLHLRHQLSEAALVWSRSGRDDSLLWRGARLIQASQEADTVGRELNRLETEFLDASVAHRDAGRRAERRRTRRLQQLTTGVAVLAAAAIAFGLFAVDARAGADTARNQALSRQVAIEAQQLQASEPALAAQLAVAAYRISPTVQARSTLIDTTASEIPYRVRGPAGPTFLAASRDRKLLAVAHSGADTVTVYTLGQGALREEAQVTAGPASGQDFAVALSGDGRLMAISGTTRDVTLWNLADPARPARVATLTGPSSTVYSLAFSPDRRRLVAADADGSLYRWEITDPHRPTSLPSLKAPGGSALKAVTFSPDGAEVAAVGAGIVAIWTGTDPQPTLAGDAGSVTYSQVAFNPTATLLAASGSDSEVHLWAVGPDRKLTRARAPLAVGTSQLDSVAINPAGSELVAGAADGTVGIFDTTSWAQIATVAHPNPVTGLAFGPGGDSLVSADSTGAIRVWPLPLQSAATSPGNVYWVMFTDRGKKLMSVSDGPGGDVRLWDTTDPAHPVATGDVRLPSALGPMAGVGALTPDGRLLAAANNQARIQLMDVTNPGTPRPVAPALTGAQPYIEQLTFSPDGRMLVSADDSGQLRIWDVSNPASPRLADSRTDTTGEVLGFAFSPDGRVLASTASDDKVRLYSLTSSGHMTPLATVGGFSNYAYSAVWTPDGKTLIAGSADGTVRLWDVTHPSRPRLLGQPLSGPTGYVFQLDLSPDGKTLAAATTNHAVWLWDVSDRSHPVLLETLSAAKNAVFTVRFSPDGHTVAASGSDDTVHLWDDEPAGAIAQICAASGQGITATEWGRYVQGASYRAPCPPV